MYEMIPYLRRGEKTYKDSKYYYIYFYKTLISQLNLDKLQEIWEKRLANGKEKSYSHLRFAMGGFNKYIEYALEYYFYFTLDIKPKDL